jgi:acetyl esterase/lipase
MARSRRSTRTSNRTPEQEAGRRFLALAAVGAANTVNARKPFAREGRASIPAFFGGWLTSELPLHSIGVQALATAGWIRKGALKTPAGWAGLGLSAASWVGLYKVWQQALGQNDIFERALREALGDDLDAGSSPLEPSGAEPVITRRRIAAGPLTQWKKRYVSGPAISYGDAGRRNELDIWRRPDLPLDGKAPVLLQVHGGAWVLGNKDQQAMPLMANMADRGWVCVSINYRLSPRSAWPAHIVDVKRAIAWVKANIAEHGGDPDFVAITGGSAGGHLSSLAALTPNLAEFQPGFEDADTTLQAAVPFYGVYDWTNRDGTGRSDMEAMLADMVLKVSRDDDPELWDHASSMTWVNPDAPPFFVVHGTNDSLVPVEQARSFVQMLRATSKETVGYAELPGAQHAFEVFDSPRTIYSAGAVHRFLEAIRHRAGQVSAVEDPEVVSTPTSIDAAESPAAATDAPKVETTVKTKKAKKPTPSKPAAESVSEPTPVSTPEAAPGSDPAAEAATASPESTLGLVALPFADHATEHVADDAVDESADPAAAAPAPLAAVPPSNGNGSGTGQVKGNRDSMKYHVPGSQWYDRTVAEEWFDTVEAAEAAGYKPAGGKSRQRVRPDA